MLGARVTHPFFLFSPRMMGMVASRLNRSTKPCDVGNPGIIELLPSNVTIRCRRWVATNNANSNQPPCSASGLIVYVYLKMTRFNYSSPMVTDNYSETWLSKCSVRPSISCCLSFHISVTGFFIPLQIIHQLDSSSSKTWGWFPLVF